MKWCGVVIDYLLHAVFSVCILRALFNSGFGFCYFLLVLGDTDDTTILDDTKISRYSRYQVSIGLLCQYRKYLAVNGIYLVDLIEIRGKA